MCSRILYYGLNDESMKHYFEELQKRNKNKQKHNKHNKVSDFYCGIDQNKPLNNYHLSVKVSKLHDQNFRNHHLSIKLSKLRDQIFCNHPSVRTTKLRDQIFCNSNFLKFKIMIHPFKYPNCVIKFFAIQISNHNLSI